jgi:hypothetical protein
MRKPVTLATAAVLLLAMSCDGHGPTRPPRQPYHVFRADASTLHDSLYSFCGIEGALPVPVMSLPPWDGQATIGVYRWTATTHGVRASRQTGVTVSFSVTQDSNELVLKLGPPLDITLTGSVVHAAMDPTNGTWTCPATLPFHDDSFLLSNGYQATPAPSGTWSLRWMSPID